MTVATVIETFTPGDVVYLKSGSSRMTIIKVEGNVATVVWSAYGTPHIEQKDIPCVALVKKTF